MKRGSSIKGNEKVNVISDTIHGMVTISNLEKRVISTRIFTRLHNISQNSTAYLTFPTNRTKRFEHSIGTMHLAGQTVLYGIGNTDYNTLNNFFAKLNNEIESIILNMISGDGDNILRAKIGDANMTKEKIMSYKNMQFNDGLYRINTPKSIFDTKNNHDYLILYTILYQALRLAGLLHDVGHPPMSHITENAIKNLYKEIDSLRVEETKKVTFPKIDSFISSIESYEKSKSELHEQIGLKLTKKVLYHIIPDYSNDNNDDQVNQNLIEVIISEVAFAILNEATPFFESLHRIIDGSLDTDRLDYITRDPLNSGIDAGRIEYSRILSQTRVVEVENVFWFCPSIKCKDTIDDFFIRRWNLYQKIVYHHRVIKTDYLLEDCIKKISTDYLSNKISITDVDESSIVIPNNISGIWHAISANPSNQVFFDSVLQWDDDWLITTLKRHFYQDYLNDKDKPMYYRLQELISNKKYYYSLIKKDQDSLSLDSSVINTFKNVIPNLDSLIQSIKAKACSHKSNGKTTEKAINLDLYLEKYNQLIAFADNKEKEHRAGTYFLSFFRFKFEEFFLSDDPSNTYSSLMQNAIQNTFKRNKSIEDAFFVIKTVKTGADKSLYLYSEDRDGKVNAISYQSISSVPNELLLKRNTMQPIHVYVKKKDESKNLDFTKIIDNLGKNIAIELNKMLEKELNYVLGLIE